MFASTARAGAEPGRSPVFGCLPVIAKLPKAVLGRLAASSRHQCGNLPIATLLTPYMPSWQDKGAFASRGGD